MRNQQHNATILKALRRDYKATESKLARQRMCAERNKVERVQAKQDAIVKRSEEYLEELAEAIKYMQSLPIYLGCTSNKGAANNEK